MRPKRKRGMKQQPSVIAECESPHNGLIRPPAWDTLRPAVLAAKPGAAASRHSRRTGVDYSD